MLNLGQYVFFIEDIPSQWIFQHYLNLTEILTGQDVKMKSVFNKEKTPSMYLYTVGNQYRFKDFSSAKGGDGIELVKALYGLSFGEAKDKILLDYETSIKSGVSKTPVREMEYHDKYKIDTYEVRGWNTTDAKYWKQFNIDSAMLEKHNVKPLRFYSMSKTVLGDKIDTVNVEKECVYGYFKGDGSLYKIYQPGQTNKKFIKVSSYIQGSEQLTSGKYLLICSSLKDLMSFKALRFNGVDVIAPDSENTMIPIEYILKLKSKYDKICTLFDNDTAGIKSMKKYELEYDIPSVHLQMEKDLSDSIRDHGLDNTRIVLYPILTKVLTGKAKFL
jgi:hypothetical protein